MAEVIKFGSWSLDTVPGGWEPLPEGLRRAGQNVFPSNVVLMEEPLPAGMTLQRYVENQIQVMQHVLPDPKVKGPESVALFASDQCQTLRVSYQSSDGQPVVQAQIYTTSGQHVGIVTFTTVQPQQAEVEKDFKSIAKGLRFAASDK